MVRNKYTNTQVIADLSHPQLEHHRPHSLCEGAKMTKDCCLVTAGLFVLNPCQLDGCHRGRGLNVHVIVFCEDHLGECAVKHQ